MLLSAFKSGIKAVPPLPHLLLAGEGVPPQRRG